MASLHKDAPLESVDVDFGEGPVTVYYRKMNLFQMDRISKKAADSQVGGVIESLLLRARTADGLRLFKDSDRSKIEKQFDADEVFRVVTEMNKKNDPAGN